MQAIPCDRCRRKKTTCAVPKNMRACVACTASHVKCERSGSTKAGADKDGEEEDDEDDEEEEVAGPSKDVHAARAPVRKMVVEVPRMLGKKGEGSSKAVEGRTGERIVIPARARVYNVDEGESEVEAKEPPPKKAKTSGERKTRSAGDGTPLGEAIASLELEVEAMKGRVEAAATALDHARSAQEMVGRKLAMVKKLAGKRK